MNFRALGSVLFRKFSPRGIPRARAQVQAAPSPAFSRADLGATVARHARPHHTIRDLTVDGSYGAVPVVAFAALAGFLYLLKKDTAMIFVTAAAEDIRTEVTTQETSREMPEVSKDGCMDDAAIREMFTDKDGNLRWCDYIDYLTFGKTFEKNKVRYQYEEVIDMEVKDEEDVESEAAMKARFEEWMKEHGKTYNSREETAMRYERFKRSAKLVDKYNASKQGSVVFGLNHLSDITEDEEQSMRPAPRDNRYWERYAEHLKIVRALRKDGHQVVYGSQILKLQGKDASHHEDKGMMSRYARRQEAIRRYQEKMESRTSSCSNEKTEPHGPI